MTVRRFVALGTGSQMPTRQRAHNAYLLEWGRHGFMFDPGEGAQRQMAFFDVRPSKVTKIFITHFHGDHCFGLPGLLQRIALDPPREPIEIYYPASGENRFGHLIALAAGDDEPNVIPRPVSSPGTVFEDDDVRVIAQPLDHRIDTWGWRIEEPDGVQFDAAKLAEAGVDGPLVRQLRDEGRLRIGERIVTLGDVSVPRPGQTLAFVMDTRLCAGAAALAEKVDTLVIESTYLNGEGADAMRNGHLTASQAAALARDTGAKKLVLTHFSPRYKGIEPFVEEAEEIHDDVVAMRDGDGIELRRPPLGSERGDDDS